MIKLKRIQVRDLSLLITYITSNGYKVVIEKGDDANSGCDFCYDVSILTKGED